MASTDYSYIAYKDGQYYSVSISDGQTWLNNGFDIYRKKPDEANDNYIAEVTDNTDVEVEATDDGLAINTDENKIATSVDMDDTSYNDGQGYKQNISIGTDGKDADSSTGYVTGYMQTMDSQELFFENLDVPVNNSAILAFYDVDKNPIRVMTTQEWVNSGHLTPINVENGNIKYITVASKQTDITEEPDDNDELDTEYIAPDDEDGSDEEALDDQEYFSSYLVYFARLYAPSITEDSAVYGSEVIPEEEEPADGNDSNIYNPLADGWELFASAGTTLPDVDEDYFVEDTVPLSGLYAYEDKQADGSVVYFMHNHNDAPTKDAAGNPIFPESDIVWRFGAEEIGVSTDNGVTYKYKMKVDGTLIAKILNTNDINVTNRVKIGAGSDRSLIIKKDSIEFTDGSSTKMQFRLNSIITELRAAGRYIEGIKSVSGSESAGYKALAPDGVRLVNGQLYVWYVKNDNYNFGYRLFMHTANTYTTSSTNKLTYNSSNSSVTDKDGIDMTNAYIQATASSEMRINGNVVIENTSDAQGHLPSESAPLVIGNPNAAHMAIDSNEIMAKSGQTNPSTLSLNADGGDVYIRVNTTEPTRFTVDNISMKTESSSYKKLLCYNAGDSFSVTWYGSGFVTSSGENVVFSIPLSKPTHPLVTRVTVTNLSDNSGGAILRQNNAYKFGSAAGSYVFPPYVTASLQEGFVNVTLDFAQIMDSQKNATNNSPIGVAAKVRINFYAF